jgi:predicted ArsR family transcriptional regulator
MRQPPTRLRILNFIRSRQAASVREMSRFLKLSGANVRHHLGVLESNALIEVVGRHKDGRGRPAQVYGLSRRILGDNLDALTLALLQNTLSGMDAASRADSLRAIAGRLTGSPAAAFSGPPVQRLVAAVGWLNAHHYQAHWEATAGGPRIVFGYCPYAAVVSRCPEVCELDRYVLEALTGKGAQQVAMRDPNVREDRLCSFRLMD